MLNPPYTAYDSYKIANPPGASIRASYQISASPTVIVIKPDRAIVEQDIWPINNTILRNKVTQHGGIPSDCNVPEIFNLTLVANPEEGGELTGEGEYEAGEDVMVTATANDGWAFINWTGAMGDTLSSESIYSFTMPDNDLELTANFELMSYTLSLLAAPEEGGEVTGAGKYYPGDEIEVDALPNENWEFINWTDPDENIISELAANTITMPEGDLTLIANFRFITLLGEQMISMKYAIYPNPVEDRLTIEADESLIGEHFIISNQAGKTVLSGKIQSKLTMINLVDLPAGMYMLSLKGMQSEPIKLIRK